MRRPAMQAAGAASSAPTTRSCPPALRLRLPTTGRLTVKNRALTRCATGFGMRARGEGLAELAGRCDVQSGPAMRGIAPFDCAQGLRRAGRALPLRTTMQTRGKARADPSRTLVECAQDDDRDWWLRPRSG